MGVMTEKQMWLPLKKSQGETNDRLDALIGEQRETGRLLRILARPGALPAPPPEAGAF
jgi:hypothetical protein